jgi:glutamine synthetase
MEKESLFVGELGRTFTEYYLCFKRTELGRYEDFAKEHEIDPASTETTEWEHNEYFDFF